MKYNKKFFLVITALLILLGGIYGGLREKAGAAQNTATAGSEQTDADISRLMESMKIKKLETPAEPPDFTLMSIAEEQINLREQRGKVVLLSFLATW
jgi:hypothetical protein